MSISDPDLGQRVARLERKYRIAFMTAAITSICSVLTIAGAAESRAGAAATTRQDREVTDVLRVRELNVVDEKGVTRVKIGAPLAHAVVDGRPNKSRGGRPEDTISGILLYDAEGNERSGYATVDRGYSNVMLTLDDQKKQHAMFIAEPTGATTLRLFNSDTKDRVDVAINKDGPYIAMVKQGKEIYRFPPK